jgi:hypothetical protein
MGRHTIRRDSVPRRRNLGPTARLTKDAIDRLNAQRESGEIPIQLARGTRESVRPPVSDEIEIIVGPTSAGESRQTSTIQGMPPIDRAPAVPPPPLAKLTQSVARRADPLAYALIVLVLCSAVFALWAMTR